MNNKSKQISFLNKPEKIYIVSIYIFYDTYITY